MSMSKDIGKELDEVDSQFHFDQKKSKWITTPRNLNRKDIRKQSGKSKTKAKVSQFNSRLKVSSKNSKASSRSKSKSRNGIVFSPRSDRDNTKPISLKSPKIGSDKMDNLSNQAIVSPHELETKGKFKFPISKVAKKSSKIPKIVVSEVETLQTDFRSPKTHQIAKFHKTIDRVEDEPPHDIVKQQTLSNNQRIDTQYILDFYNVKKDPETVPKSLRKQIHEELAPIGEKLHNLMQSCEEDNPTLFNHNILDIKNFKNLEEMTREAGIRTRPYSKSNIHMNMGTVREFLSGDTVTRLEIYEEKEKIKQKVEKRLRKESVNQKKVDLKQLQQDKIQEMRDNGIKVQKLRKSLEEKRSRKQSKSSSKVSRVVLVKKKSVKDGDNMLLKNPNKFKLMKDQIMITESTQLPTGNSKTLQSNGVQISLRNIQQNHLSEKNKSYQLKKSLSASKTHLMFLNKDDQSDIEEPPLNNSNDLSLVNSEADKPGGRKLSNLVKQETESNTSLPFLFPKSIKDMTRSVTEQSEGNKQKYMLKQGFKKLPMSSRPAKNNQSLQMKSAMKSARQENNSTNHKNSRLIGHSMGLEPISVPQTGQKKVTFLKINSKSKKKHKLTRPVNWNGLDAIAPKYGMRGFGFTGNKSGCIDIKHFIRQEKRRLNKSHNHKPDPNASFTISIDGNTKLNYSNLAQQLGKMTSLETIDEDTINSIMEHSNFPHSPHTRRRMAKDLKNQLRLSLTQVNEQSEEILPPLNSGRNEPSFGQLGFNSEFSQHHLSRVDPKFRLSHRKEKKSAPAGKNGKQRGNWRNQRGRKYKTKNDVVKFDARIVNSLKRKINHVRSGQIGNGVYFMPVDDD